METSSYGHLGLEKVFKIAHEKRILVVTLGNELRGDDSLGVKLAEALCKQGLGDKLLNAGIMLENLISVIIRRRPEVVIFVDAIDANLNPGEIVVYDFDEDFKEITPLTTHKLPLKVIAKFIRKELSDVKIFLIGVQVKSYEFGDEMSEEVKSALNKLKVFFRKLLTSTP
ncbi:MAG: hydrogenase maturation protease [Thermoprotei archaeon]|nr:hydrogenase maturation protease [Thermoprotei archaeon]